jgi:hypothetical protein
VLAQLQAQADKFKPSLAVFQADTDIVVNTRPFRRADPVIVIPHSNHSTVTKCLTPRDTIVVEVLRILDGQVFAKPIESSSWERIIRLFFERSGALAAYELLIKGKLFFAGEALKYQQQDIVMRDYNQEAIELFSEQTCRDLLDRFVDFLAMAELAIANKLCGVAALTALVDVHGLIGNGPFRRYLEYYPNVLVDRLFLRVSQPGQAVSHGPASPVSVQLFVDTAEAIANNPRIQLLFRLLDDFGFRGINWYSVLDQLDGSQQHKGTADEVLADAIRGLGDYMEALEWLFGDDRLDAFENDVILFHSYWINRLAEEKDRLLKIQERVRATLPSADPIYRTFDRCFALIDIVGSEH